MLGIELTNVCNFKCYFCGSRKVEKHNTITTKVFKEIIDEASSLGITFIKLTPSDGEIFTDPEIMEKLEYLEASSITKVHFHTNFSLIDPDIQDRLVRFRKLTIMVSDYGDGDMEMFKHMTRTNDSMFVRYQRNLSYAKKISLSIIMHSRNTSYDFSYDNSNDETVEEIYRTSNEREIVKKEGVCSFMYLPRILSNGDFSYCTCAGEHIDLSNEMIIGNIYETSLTDLYLSAERHKMLAEQKLNKYCDYCKGCDTFSTTAIVPGLSVFKNFMKMKARYDS